MRRFVIRDPLGLIIKLLISLILWYKCLIQRYVEIPNMLLILGALLVLVVLIDCRGQLQRVFFGNPASENLLFIYVILTFVLGIISASNISLHLSTGFLVIEFFAVSLLILYYIKSRGNYEFILKKYIVIFGIMTILFLMNPVAVSSKEGTRYSLTENLNENTLAMYFSMLIFGIVFYISKGKIRPWLGFIICGIAFYAIFMTGSRKGFISALLIFILWIFWVYIPDRKGNILLRCLAVGILLMLTAYILFPYFLDSSLWLRLNNLRDNGNHMRVDMYEIGIKMIAARPISGYGFDGFRYYYGTYSHSTILEVFISSGIPVGLVYFASLIALFVENRKYNKMIRTFSDLQFHHIESKMGAILYFSIVVSTLYIIHIFDFLTFYNLTLIMAPGLIRRKAENEGYIDGKQ